MDRNGRYEVDLVPLGVGLDHEGGAASPLAAARSSELVACQPEIAPRQAAPPPTGGWRRALWELTGHSLSLLSPRDRLAERAALLRRELTRPWTVAFMSMKGGMGKTTTCASVGYAFASERGDHVVALDFDPDSGGAGALLARLITFDLIPRCAARWMCVEGSPSAFTPSRRMGPVGPGVPGV